MNEHKRLTEAPYYAVIFSSKRTADDHGYAEMDQKLDELVVNQPGYLGAESVRNDEGKGITISYWASLEDIKNWKQNELHKTAQQQGREVWYENYTVRICKVEREYSFGEI